MADILRVRTDNNMIGRLDQFIQHPFYTGIQNIVFLPGRRYQDRLVLLPLRSIFPHHLLISFGHIVNDTGTPLHKVLCRQSVFLFPLRNLALILGTRCENGIVVIQRIFVKGQIRAVHIMLHINIFNIFLYIRPL